MRVFSRFLEKCSVPRFGTCGTNIKLAILKSDLIISPSRGTGFALARCVPSRCCALLSYSTRYARVTCAALRLAHPPTTLTPVPCAKI